MRTHLIARDFTDEIETTGKRPRRSNGSVGRLASRLSALLLALLVAFAGARTASAEPGAGRTRATRTRVRRPAFAQQLRRRLIAAGAEVVKSNRVFYHQIKDPKHRAHWQAKHKTKGLAMLGEWLSAGGYPGIWTLENKDGWYGKHAGNPVKLKLTPGAIFIDLESPGQKAIYEAWKAQRPKADPAKDLFALLKDATGTPLSKKVGGVRAPAEGRFLQDLNIAGVVWYDTYGRRCPIVLNPDAVQSVSFE